MSRALLFAVEDDGPRRLETPAQARGFDGLYDGLALGVYSALRTFGKFCFLDLAGHIERTRRSLERIGSDHRLDEARLRRCLDAACRGAPFDEMRVRFDVLAAPASARGSDARELIALVPFTPAPRSIRERGVDVVMTHAIARGDPLAKTADFVERRRRVEAETPGAYERLLVNDVGELLEGFSSNFYIVEDARLRTAGKGVLEGVTRNAVLALARERGIATDLRAPLAARIGDADEAAISSSSRGLVPVVRIDGVAVGDGRPGPIVGALAAAYDDWVARTVRPAV